MTYASDWLKVHMRPVDPSAPVFEVVHGDSGEWHYRQRRSGRITNSSENYSTRSNARRAAYAQAALIAGSKVRMLHAFDEGFDEV